MVCRCLCINVNYRFWERGYTPPKGVTEEGGSRDGGGLKRMGIGQSSVSGSGTERPLAWNFRKGETCGSRASVSDSYLQGV